MPTATPTILRLQRLRALREHHHISQTVLAAMSGMTQATVSLAERGHATRNTLERLARALGAGDPGTLLHIVAYEERRTAAAPLSQMLVT